MSKTGKKSLPEIKEITREYIAKEFNVPKDSIVVEAKLEDIAGEPIYNVSGHAKWKWGGSLGIGRKKSAIRRFEIQIEAWTGVIVGEKLFELEEMK